MGWDDRDVYNGQAVLTVHPHRTAHWYCRSNQIVMGADEQGKSLCHTAVKVLVASVVSTSLRHHGL